MVNTCCPGPCQRCRDEGEFRIDDATVECPCAAGDALRRAQAVACCAESDQPMRTGKVRGPRT